MPLFKGNLLLFVPLFGNTYRDGLNTLGRCTNLVAPIKVRGDGQLGGAHSLCLFWREISSFLCHFLETLTETGSIHWVGVQTWLRSSHEGDDTLEGARSLCHFLREISSFSRHFLETLAETGSIHWVDVQT